MIFSQLYAVFSLIVTISWGNVIIIQVKSQCLWCSYFWTEWSLIAASFWPWLHFAWWLKVMWRPQPGCTDRWPWFTGWRATRKNSRNWEGGWRRISLASKLSRSMPLTTTTACPPLWDRFTGSLISWRRSLPCTARWLFSASPRGDTFPGVSSRCLTIRLFTLSYLLRPLVRLCSTRFHSDPAEVHGRVFAWKQREIMIISAIISKFIFCEKPFSSKTQIWLKNVWNPVFVHCGEKVD